ncbi:S8 family serine peptidase [Sinomonas halotolerans]|uniref:S8 family serine peptidase n=1 Tax=Sinomonas halotolerans TaxID=1644133 RepID=A0ABU9X0F8_9MICC
MAPSTAASARRPRPVAALVSAALVAGSFLAAAPAALAVDRAPADTVPAAPGVQRIPAQATDRLVVKFADRAKALPERAKAYGRLARELGLSVREVRQTATGAQVLAAGHRLTPQEAAAAVSSLKASGLVQYAEPDTVMQPSYTPNDPEYPRQWNLFEATGGLSLPPVWDRTTGAGVTVAVVDTGITAHSDLAANILPGYDFISDPAVARDGDGRDANPQDEGDYLVAGQCGASQSSSSSWHGTHVAGIIGAVAGNGKGLVGAAYGAKVVPVRALGACGGYMSDIADGLVWGSGGSVPGLPANANPARIVNMSLGAAETCSATMQGAINGAVSRGAAVFVAAGNSNMSTATTSPANCANVITVAATNRAGVRAPYSNYGAEVDIAAPGGDMSASVTGGIASTLNAGTTTPAGEAYAYMQGTSMATPMAAAAGALVLSLEPALTPAELEARLKSTARPLAAPCAGCGTGIVDPAAALAAPVASPSALSGPVPTVGGTAKVGSTLTATAGTWEPAPVELAYQWKRGGVAIPGATAAAYTAVAADAGTSLSVTVTGTKSGFDPVSQTSAGTAAVAAGTLASSAPTISGTAKVGYTLKANPGTWTAGTSFRYQWYRSGAAISGATGQYYKLVAADRGRTMTVRVTGSQAGYTSVSRLSAATAAVAAGTLVSSTPTISGTAKVGYTLKANPGTWTAGTSFYYQWYRSGWAIKGATGQYYKLTSVDRYRGIKVRVIGVKAGYTSVARFSGTRTVY